MPLRPIRQALTLVLLLLLASGAASAATFSGAYTVTIYKHPGHVNQGSVCITFTPGKIAVGFPNGGTIVVGDVAGGEYIVVGTVLTFFVNNGISESSSGGEIQINATTSSYRVPLGGKSLVGSYLTTTSTVSTISPNAGIMPDVVGEIAMAPGC